MSVLVVRAEDGAGEKANLEAAQTESAQTETGETEPVQTESAQMETGETEPAQTEPAQTETGETEPAQTETVQPETEPAAPPKQMADLGKIASIVAESANGGLSSDRRVAKLQKKCPLRKNTGKILLAGGSSIRRWETAAKQFAPIETVNMGIGGSTTKDWLKWYKKLIVEYQPRAVVLYVGGNDFCDNKSKGKDVAKRCQNLIEALQKEMQDVKIYYIAVCPSPARRQYQKQVNVYNKSMKNFCKKSKNLYYIDFGASFYKNGKLQTGLYVGDGLHLSSKGYQLWNKAVVKKVKAGLKSKEN